jgi:glycerol-3-phosphate dehydrogenase (NAD(P)+)
VLGAGSWGTTFAMVLADAGVPVSIWGRRPEVVAEISRSSRNSEYLPHTVLPDSVTASGDAAEVLAGADLVVLAVPSQSLRANLAEWRTWLEPDALLVSLMKGVELDTHLRMSEVVAQVTGVDADRVSVVSGPNLAAEIAARQPTATVVACVDGDQAERVAAACSTPYFRPYTQTDVVGVEIGGAVKNVIALAVGIAEGLGFGDNTQASLITRGLAETARLAAALGAEPATLSGLAGMGDLVATCASPLSRNRTFGVNLGRGRTVAEVVSATRRTAEGVVSCRSILDLAASVGVDVPIVQHVVHVVVDGMPASEMAGSLLSRSLKAE